MTEQKPIGMPGLPGMRLDLNASTSRPGLEVDVERYQAMLDAPGMSDAQKEEAIRALWSIVTAFVELGFRVDPASLACGQDSDDCGAQLSDVLSSAQSETPEQNQISADDPESAADRKEES